MSIEEAVSGNCSDTRAHGKAWVIRNDAEGRTLLGKLETALRALAEKKEAAEGIGR